MKKIKKRKKDLFGMKTARQSQITAGKRNERVNRSHHDCSHTKVPDKIQEATFRMNIGDTINEQ